MLYRFVNIEQRMEVWSRRPLAKKNNLYMEEWLTGKSLISIGFLYRLFFIIGYREKLFVKCKLLKKDGLIKDVFTERGDIKVMGGYPFKAIGAGTGKLSKNFGI